MTAVPSTFAGHPKADAQKALQLTFKAKDKLRLIPNTTAYRTDRRIIDHHLDILKGRFSHAAAPNHPLEAVENRMENIYKADRHHFTKIQHQLKQLMRKTDKLNDKATYDKAKFVYQIVDEIRRIVYDYK